jgi:hypothetical protein
MNIFFTTKKTTGEELGFLPANPLAATQNPFIPLSLIRRALRGSYRFWF